MSSAVNDNFSCYEKLDHLHFGPLFSGDELASCNSVFAPDETTTTGVTRQTNETPPERSAEDSVNSISGGHY